MHFGQGRDRNLLFCSGDLSQALQSMLAKIPGYVEAIPKDQFLISSDTELIENIRPRLIANPLILHEDAKTMEQTEGKIDVSYNRNRNPFGDSGPIMVPSLKVVVEVPFDGDPDLWQMRPNQYDMSPPIADIRGNSLYITVELPHDENQEKFKQAIEGTLRSINQYVGYQLPMLDSYNESLERHISEAVHRRKTILKKSGELQDMLGIPMKTKGGAAPIKPVSIHSTHPKPLRTPPKTGVMPEPGISEDQFSVIQKVIRHWGRTAEGSPSGFSKLNEEELRDAILANLNSHFEGGATGERFRNQGKTDICIMEDDRAAFVAECKMWTGPKSVADALDQLLGYLTWRDCKASLIFFNINVAGFTDILTKFETALSNHELHIEGPTESGDGEWSYIFKSAEDEGRRVLVKVFIFNIFSAQPRITRL